MGTGNVPTLSQNISSRIYIIKDNHSNTNGRVEIASSNTTSVSQEYILPSSIGTVNQILKIGSVDSNNSNKLTLVWDTGGGGGSSTNATTINIANDTSDSECFIVFSNNATGDVALNTNNNIKFNSNDGILTTTAFNGSLTGNATTATNLNSVQSISKGGTGATTASAARTALGVDAAGTNNSTNVMLSSVAGNYLTLDEDNQILTADVVPISLGGTGATTASAARTALGVDVAGTDNSTDLMLSSIAGNYLTLDEDNQILTAGVVPISLGGTNATSASTARTALGVDAAGTDNSTNVMLSSVAGNYLSLDEDNQILTAGIVPISLGGTNATTASAARDNLDAQILLTDNEGEFTTEDQSKLNDSSMESNADTTSFTDVVNAGGLMTFNNTKSITGDIVIGEDDNDLMIVNSNIISNGYIKKPTRFKPKTTIVGTPFTLNFGTALDTITHLDGTSSAIDTRVYLDDIKDINKVLVMGKIHIGYSFWNIFASVLLIKKLYNSLGNVITSAGNSGNIEVGSGSDDISNTTDSFFDASIGVTPGGVYNFVAVLNNLGGHFLDTNPTEGVSGVSKISYHYAIKPLHDNNNSIKVGQPWNAGDENRSSAATMLTLVPFCS